MALNALGAKITQALSKLSKASSSDDEVLKAVLKDICGALLEADVNVQVSHASVPS